MKKLFVLLCMLLASACSGVDMSLDEYTVPMTSSPSSELFEAFTLCERGRFKYNGKTQAQMARVKDEMYIEYGGKKVVVFGVVRGATIIDMDFPIPDFAWINLKLPGSKTIVKITGVSTSAATEVERDQLLVISGRYVEVDCHYKKTTIRAEKIQRARTE